MQPMVRLDKLKAKTKSRCNKIAGKLFETFEQAQCCKDVKVQAHVYQGQLYGQMSSNA